MKLALIQYILPVIALSLSLGATATIAQTPRPQSTGGGLSVAPIRLMLSGTARSVSLVVSNPGDEPVTVQVRLFAWTMRGDEEVYDTATDIGFSPPLFRLAPHAAQSVRVVAKVPPGPVERSYRLIVDQLPLANAPGQLQLPVRMVLPVFVEPTADISRRPMLEWSAHQDAQSKKITIAVSNRGAVHARLADLAIHDGVNSAVVAPGLAGYALAGQQREWLYAADNLLESLDITAHEGARALRVTVPVTRR